MLCATEEGRAASKNLAIVFLFPSKYFLPISLKFQLLHYFNREYWNKHIYSTRREETAHLATLKSKKYKSDSLPKDIAEIATEMAEKSSPGTRQTDSKNLVWFGEIERKLAKLSMPTFTYRSSS